ncbi:MAG: sulfotransferase [Candidatus Binataceae bacterium]
MMELTASPADRSLGDDKTFPDMPYGKDLSYTCADGEGKKGIGLKCIFDLHRAKLYLTASGVQHSHWIFASFRSGRHRLRGGMNERDNRFVSASKPVRPNFFIVGAQNSGTSSLYEYLKQHPQIFLPALKEPHFFCEDRPASAMTYPITRVSRPEAYLALYSRAGEYEAIGDASSSYLWDPGAPRRIRQVSPRARIIMMLRDPVERAHSHYLMDVREGWQRLAFYDALREDFHRGRKGYGVSRLYVELGLYHQQVGRYLRMFGAKQVKILQFDSLLTPDGRRRTICEIADFLGLDAEPVTKIDTSRRENEFGVARWKWASRIAGARTVRRAAQAVVPAGLGSTYRLKKSVFERFFVKRAGKPPMDPMAREWLVSLFKEDVRALEKMFGRMFPELRRSWQLNRDGSSRAASLGERVESRR